ncbi:hypothetical protein F4777DRAFT_547368 [Nemania sp. FL0916]|nr:hypothetical protein F4777DRAFT_547368 [Nemania sp. FL0916]
MFSFEKATMAMCLALAIVASPVPPASDVPTQLDAPNNTFFQPTMYQIFPRDARKSGPAVSQLQVVRADNGSTLENIAVFKGIPSNAKTCMLGWVQAAKPERTEFVVQGSGLLATQQLSSLPNGDVNWEKIAPIAQEAVTQERPLLHPDTTSWPNIETAASHIAGFIDCAETIYLKIQVDDRNPAGSVYLGQDTKNGLTLQVQG